MNTEMKLRLMEKAECPLADKLSLLPLVQTMYNLAAIARKDGLTSVEDNIAGLEDPTLRMAMQLIVDGTSPETVAEILLFRMLSSDATGAELLKHIVIYRGTLAIQDWQQPLSVVDMLVSLLGEEIWADHPYIKEKSAYREEYNRELERVSKACPNPTKAMDEIHSYASPASPVERYLHRSTLLYALCRAREHVRKAVIRSYPYYERLLFIKKMDELDGKAANGPNPELNELVHLSQKKVMESFTRLFY